MDLSSVIRESIYGIGHSITRIALTRPFHHRKTAHHVYAFAFSCAKRFLEKPEHRFFRQYIRRGMTVFDIGAHSGHYTNFFSSLVGEHGCVYSFEPDPWSFEVLRHSTAQKSNIRNMQLALGSAEEKTSFYPNARSRADSSLFYREHAEEPTAVTMKSIDSFCREQSIAHIDAMKIDAEGAEFAILQGAQTTIAAVVPQWIFLELFPLALQRAHSSPKALCAFLTERGYKLHSLSPDGQPIPITNPPAFIAQHATGNYTNIVAVHEHSRCGE